MIRDWDRQTDKQALYLKHRPTSSSFFKSSNDHRNNKATAAATQLQHRTRTQFSFFLLCVVWGDYIKEPETWRPVTVQTKGPKPGYRALDRSMGLTCRVGLVFPLHIGFFLVIFHYIKKSLCSIVLTGHFFLICSQHGRTERRYPRQTHKELKAYELNLLRSRE